MLGYSASASHSPVGGLVLQNFSDFFFLQILCVIVVDVTLSEGFLLAALRAVQGAGI